MTKQGEQASSPTATGPAGSLFEGQVGAYYLLSLLSDSEPRGLPGCRIDRVALQRGPEGYPLDDVVVHATDPQGIALTLEIQVKRSITFARSDREFKAVVAQIAAASVTEEFKAGTCGLAVAIARTSRQIAGPYQDVLTWARQTESASTFFARLTRPGSANDDMRRFVETFQAHLRDAGARDNDTLVWAILRKLQLLVFDFTARGSACEELARERAGQALVPDAAPQAGSLWANLVDIAIETAASAGAKDRETLGEVLRARSFRLAGARRYVTTRKTLAEASAAVLADIDDRVGGARLGRPERLAAVRAALDSGRYVEIRGDAGVGKSGLLKHFAEASAAEAPTIVLAPGRVPVGGWLALRSVLNFDGGARELLSDLASDGAAVLCIDNLDFYDDNERKTVNDLVRAAATVPGFAVIATGRHRLATDVHGWLPAEALDRLGRADPVLVDELTEAEVVELRHAAPSLAGLLADDHPARDIARNLYRIARLARELAGQPHPRTEAEMAAAWWLTADGAADAGHRDRARLLRSLAEQSLTSQGPFDARGAPTAAVDALVSSMTLRDLGNDRVVFRHDVLREWAVGSLLADSPEIFDQLLLAAPAPAALARGVELASRFALELPSDPDAWSALLERVSRPDDHGSWRRGALLAIVRSELGAQLLARWQGSLLADHGDLLRELIRTVMAVDVRPASELFVGLEARLRGLNFPIGRSWYRLVTWLLSLGPALPPETLPDVVACFTLWSTGTLGGDRLTPHVLQQLHAWLAEIEADDDARPGEGAILFGGVLSHLQLRSLEVDLRTGLLLHCNRVPDLAAAYVNAQRRRRGHSDCAAGIMEFYGKLAEAAPAELAALTAEYLIEGARDGGEPYRGSPFRRPFDHVDSAFLPPSPDKGPFLDLLRHAPEHGLRLIHRLVDHAVAAWSDGQAHDPDPVIVVLPHGERPFPWAQTYTWSRGAAGSYCLTSALMALEAWGHSRIQAGVPIQAVIDEILGDDGQPAVYLQVAADWILSHWPESRDAAVPFVGSPALLCLDRQRLVTDAMGSALRLGGGAADRGVVELSAFASRRRSLDQLLGPYALSAPTEQHERLRALLRAAAARLGAPALGGRLDEPAMMAVHALNLSDRANWVEAYPGAPPQALRYHPPAAERQHFERLQAEVAASLETNDMVRALDDALDDGGRSSPQFAAAAVAWAQTAATAATDTGSSPDWGPGQAVVVAAMIAMRDGDLDLASRQCDWAEEVFAGVFRAPEEAGHRYRDGMRFNPVAIAFVGVTHLLKRKREIGHPAPTGRGGVRDWVRRRLAWAVPSRARVRLGEREPLRRVLEAAGHSPAAAHGFAVALPVIVSIDERLPRAVLRSALAAARRPMLPWNEAQGVNAAAVAVQRQHLAAAVAAELSWLEQRGAEPGWPSLPAPLVRPRERVYLGQVGRPPRTVEREQPPEYADHQAAAIWLNQSAALFAKDAPGWFRAMVGAYAGWTGAANGLGIAPEEEVADRPGEWNIAYFRALARCLSGLRPGEIDRAALDLITSLPDEGFLEATSNFLPSVDALFFDDGALEPDSAVRIRHRISDRLMRCASWQRLRRDASPSFARDLGWAVAIVFFNNPGFGTSASCYLAEAAIDRLGPFLPTLRALVEAGPSFLVASMALNLLEVSVRGAHLDLLVAASETWLGAFPDSAPFWIEHQFGRRVCDLLVRIWRSDPSQLALGTPVRARVDRVLARLVPIGVADAVRLERALGGP